MLARLVPIALLAAAPLVHADTYIPLTLPTLNTDVRTYSDGAAYQPLFPGLQTWNGVPFQLAVDASGDTAFAQGVLDIPVGVFGVTRAFTIANSAFGAFGAVNGSVEFFGTSGYLKVDLVQGGNIRDHFDHVHNNVIDNVGAVPAFFIGPGRARLDQQIYDLPAVFAQETLVGIRFTGLDQGLAGIPFLAAATVAVAAPVPELPAYALLLAGLALLRTAQARRRH